MNKVKELFNSDKSDSSHSHSHNHTDNGAAVGGRESSSLTGSHNNATANNEGLASSHGVTSGATEGSRSHVASDPSVPDHKHNILDHHSIDNANATHDHKHLGAVTHDKHVEHETEEVIRQKQHDRHIHHVQHHTQPVLDTVHQETQHREQVHPVTHVREQHVNTDEDKKLFAGLAKHHDETTHAGKERTVVDKGEVVDEKLHHHVHHVVQPVIERDTHHHSTIHTTIPVKHVTHEAPIVHQSSSHEPMHMKDFLAQGGDLKSKLTHDNSGVLATGECARESEGPAEELARKLHLGSGSHHSGSTGTTGTTGTGLTGNNHGTTGTGLTGNHGTTGTHGTTTNANTAL